MEDWPSSLITLLGEAFPISPSRPQLPPQSVFQLQLEPISLQPLAFAAHAVHPERGQQLAPPAVVPTVPEPLVEASLPSLCFLWTGARTSDDLGREGMRREGLPPLEVLNDLAFW